MGGSEIIPYNYLPLVECSKILLSARFSTLITLFWIQQDMFWLVSFPCASTKKLAAMINTTASRTNPSSADSSSKMHNATLTSVGICLDIIFVELC